MNIVFIHIPLLRHLAPSSTQLQDCPQEGQLCLRPSSFRKKEKKINPPPNLTSFQSHQILPTKGLPGPLPPSPSLPSTKPASVPTPLMSSSDVTSSTHRVCSQGSYGSQCLPQSIRAVLPSCHLLHPSLHPIHQDQPEGPRAPASYCLPWAADPTFPCLHDFST